MKQKKIEDASNLLVEGAKDLLKHKQVGSAADLTTRLLELYTDEKMPVNDVNKGRIIEIFQMFPVDDVYHREFVNASIRWSAKFGECPTGDPQLHHIFGSRFYQEKLYYDAEAHFMYGTLDSAKAVGRMDYEWTAEPDTPDVGYYIARSVLQLLSLKKIHHAQIAFNAFSKALLANKPDLKGISLPFQSSSSSAASSSSSSSPSEVTLFKSSLANFAQFMLLCVQREAVDQFVTLRSQYRVALEVDPYLFKLVDRIAGVFFGLGPKKQPNIFEDLMKSMFAGPPGPSSGSGGSRKPVLMEVD
ncbi:hypothetical protein HK102_011964 [Quaeritorhiza haematococci]|nr:hypothetical protein HK102_011964 [Quaeritorhiza haematococci]